MDIKIYDLFGINIKSKNCNDNFIIIDIQSPEYIDLLLVPISQYNGTYIYKYECSEEFKNYCKEQGLNIDNYIKLGDYIIYDTSDIKILLANKKSVFITDRYTLLDTIGQLYIWKPNNINNNYTNLGVICLSQTNEIPTEPIGLIPNEYIKIFESNYSDLFQNEYCILGSKLNGKRKLITLNTIDKNKIIENNNESKHNINNKWEKYQNDIIKLTIAKIQWHKDIKQIIPSEKIDNSNFIKKYKKIKQNKENKDIKLDIDNNKIIEKSSFDKSTYVIVILFILIILLFLYNKYQKKSKV